MKTWNLEKAIYIIKPIRLINFKIIKEIHSYLTLFMTLVTVNFINYLH